MTKTTVLSEQEIKNALKELPGWTYADNKIQKKFSFKDFMDSLNFINSLAPFFEQHDHHPDTHLFYSKVLFELQRFDIGGKVTNLDITTAHKIEKAYQERASSAQKP